MDAQKKDEKTDRLLALMIAHHLPTYEHSNRVGRLCGHAALDALPMHDAGEIWRIALLHDVGKLALSPYLLSKHTITEYEFEVIKMHAKYGYELLKENDPLAACIAGKHHPSYAVPEYLSLHFSTEDRRLVDDVLPLVTVCDFYDAMLTRNNGRSISQEALHAGGLAEILRREFGKAHGSTLGEKLKEYERFIPFVTDPYLFKKVYEVIP